MDWFIPVRAINNRTGKWYLGIAAVSDENELNALKDMESCKSQKLSKEKLSWDFGTTSYETRTFTSGCYYFNSKNDDWLSDGLDVRQKSYECSATEQIIHLSQVMNATNLVSACAATHLTAFATGFLPQLNTIDFEFIFTASSFQDNMTIFLFFIICFSFYIIMMIWAIIKDMKDIKEVSFLENKFVAC